MSCLAFTNLEKSSISQLPITKLLFCYCTIMQGGVSALLKCSSAGESVIYYFTLYNTFKQNKC